MKLLGDDFIWLKGLAFGAIIYYIFYGGIAKLVIPIHILQPDLITSVIFMIGNLLFGLASALTVKYFLTSERKIP